MKGSVLAQPEVKLMLAEFIIAELYTDGGPAAQENSDLEVNRFGTVALPLYVLLGPDGKERARLDRVATTAEFLEFLRKGL